jgi:hypothetical protein
VALGAAGCALAFFSGYLFELGRARQLTNRHLRAESGGQLALARLPWAQIVAACAVALAVARAIDATLPSIAGGMAGAVAGLGAFAAVALGWRVITVAQIRGVVESALRAE